METCSPCLNGKHEECVNEIVEEIICGCAHIDSPTPTPVLGTIAAALEEQGLSEVGEESTRRLKLDSAVTDPQSTGRKRAAALYPLKDEKGNRVPCDLANKKAPTLPNYMEVQIDGCGVRPATIATHARARHHNDYNTLNNERENILLLCNSCHALLHAKNDPFKDVIYERIYGFKPDTSDLKWANKALKSGIVGGGYIASKDETLR